MKYHEVNIGSKYTDGMCIYTVTGPGDSPHSVEVSKYDIYTAEKVEGGAYYGITKLKEL